MFRSHRHWRVSAVVAGLAALGAVRSLTAQPRPAAPPKEQTYLPVVSDKSFDEVRAADEREAQAVADAMQVLLRQRYDLANTPSDVPMSGGRKTVQKGVRVRLPQGVSWEDLGVLEPAQIKQRNLFPMGFRPLPHTKQATGGQVIPPDHIKAILDAEHRNLQRFDVKFDLPEHFIPEFPPPIFLTTRPELGDVSQGKVVTIKNYFELFEGKLTGVQMEGLRLLLTPFPQQQFNQTGDRKTVEAELGISCLDCHTNGHTNGAFHLTPDVRPQTHRMRLDTVSLRGMFNQQIHGSKRSLRSIEDFTEFEQRTAYFDGDQVTAAKKGVNLPDRASQVAMMAQMQNLFDFPPTPKLDAFGKLDPAVASEGEMRGQAIFFGKGKCAECHQPPFYLDNKMHDLKAGRFYEIETVLGQTNISEGPIKTFTLRGIKDSPPYLHDGRLLTLADTVEYFNVVLGLRLSTQEKADLVTFLLCL